LTWFLELGGGATINRREKAIFVEARILALKVLCQVQREDFDNFVFSDWSLVFFGQAFAQDACDCGVVFFGHVVMMIDFVVGVKRFLARPAVALFDAVQPLQFTLESVFRTFHPQGAVIILREGKVESFDALLSAPAFGVSVFVHVYKSIRMIEKVKRLFSQVFCDLGRCRHFQMARVEQGYLPVMVNVGLVAFVTDDAIDFVSDCPELGFLWCFFFHA
jgi:hypothetical protein